MPCNDSNRPPYDIEAGIEKFCQVIVHRFDQMRPDEKDWYRGVWASDAEAVIRAALPGEQPS